MSRGSFVIDNGKIISAENTFMSSENRSYKYGDGLFETIRTIKGQMPFWDFHIQRLKSGLDILEIEAKPFDWNKLKEECAELLE